MTNADLWGAIRKNIRERRSVFSFVHRTNSGSRIKRLTKRQRDIGGAYRPRRSAKGEVPRNACRSSINTNRHLRPVTLVRRAENRRTAWGSVHTCAHFYALIWTRINREDLANVTLKKKWYAGVVGMLTVAMLTFILD